MTVYSAPIPGLVCADHTVDVPLDHGDPTRGNLQVYAREVRASEHADDEQPYLLFLQGGPGGASPRPVSRGGWIGAAVEHYRVLLLDQRGTGRSTPVTDRTAARFADDAALADYLAMFRADSIVRDAELLRAQVGGGAPWTTLGQSYGGFCTMTYLSLAPEALSGCLVTGGLPGLGANVDDVYRRTWPRVIAKNAEYRRRFPGDQDVLRRLRDAITARPAGDPVRLPGGDPLTVHRLQSLGGVFGFSYGFAEVHYLLEYAFDGDEISTEFLADFEQHTSHVGRPLYAVLQEACYTQGEASRWSAERIHAEFPEAAPDAEDVVLFGEMKESAIFRDEAYLRPFAGATEILHAKQDWPALWDRQRLAGNEVPVAAAIYFDDLYVDAQLSLQTAGEVPHVRPWVTNQYEHDGLRSEPDELLGRLRDLATGRA